MLGYVLIGNVRGVCTLSQHLPLCSLWRWPTKYHWVKGYRANTCAEQASHTTRCDLNTYLVDAIELVSLLYAVVDHTLELFSHLLRVLDIENSLFKLTNERNSEIFILPHLILPVSCFPRPARWNDTDNRAQGVASSGCHPWRQLYIQLRAEDGTLSNFPEESYNISGRRATGIGSARNRMINEIPGSLVGTWLCLATKLDCLTTSLWHVSVLAGLE